MPPRIPADEAAITAWLDGAVNFERSGAFAGIRLERIAGALAALPPPPAPCTVAGTKGKGSTVRLIEAALLAQGVPVLAFTSPHVRSVRERWRCAGVPVDVAGLADACSAVAALEERLGAPLTWFERTFAIACLLARARAGTRFLVEVGLGGRLDCANALDAQVAVLTHLSHDHRDILGPTLEHIAREKLAIARPGRPLLIAPQSAAAAAAIRAVLAGSAAPAPEVRWIAPPATPFALALAGAHQQDNAATALAAAAAMHPGLDEAAARRGMAAATLAARCQVVERAGRRLVVDGAHNRESIAATLATAAGLLRPGWRLIIALAGDKELAEIAEAIPAGLAVTRCGYASPRARRAADWLPAQRAWPWHDGIAAALAAQPAEADVCITGSLYLAGEALALLGEDGLVG